MKLRALVANSLLLLATTVYGIDHDAEVKNLLAKMREAYSSTKTARIVVKTSGARFGKESITTDLTYMKERKIYARVSGGSAPSGRARLFISDGVKISIEDLSNHVQLSEFDLDFIPIPINLEAMSFWDWKRQLSTAPGANMEESEFRLRKEVKWKGKEWLVLEETAHGQDVYVEYYIDPKSFFIYRCLVYDLRKSQQRLETVVIKLERNIRVDPNLFRISAKPPTGTRRTVEKKIGFSS